MPKKKPHLYGKTTRERPRMYGPQGRRKQDVFDQFMSFPEKQRPAIPKKKKSKKKTKSKKK